MTAKTTLAELRRRVEPFIPFDSAQYINELFTTLGGEIDKLEGGKSEGLSAWVETPAVKPIAPDKAKEALKQLNKQRIPAFVIEIVNSMLVEKANSNHVRIFLEDVVEAILARGHVGVTREDIFNNHWLDFEDIFREGGWTVVYDQPGYCESYKAYWRFSK